MYKVNNFIHSECICVCICQYQFLPPPPPPWYPYIYSLHLCLYYSLQISSVSSTLDFPNSQSHMVSKWHTHVLSRCHVQLLKSTRLLCLWNFPGKTTGWGAISYSRDSSQPRDRTGVFCTSCIGRRRILYH